MNRRHFLSASAAATAGLLLPRSLPAQEEAAAAPAPTAQPKIPRWRGFNLTELTGGRRGQRFRRSDFEWMAEWGFDFARLPMSYWAWSSADQWMEID